MYYYEILRIHAAFKPFGCRAVRYSLICKKKINKSKEGKT
jgi:hypothetical protein